MIALTGADAGTEEAMTRRVISGCRDSARREVIE
jgi:hypothetical protein